MIENGRSTEGEAAQGALAVPHDRRARIVLVLPTYLPESYGGAEQQSRKFASALVSRGMSVTLLAPRIEATTPKAEWKDGVWIERFRLGSLPNYGGRHFPSFAWWSLRTIWWLWRNRHDYDIIHIIHGRLHAVGPVLGGKLAGKPTLIKFGRGGEQFDIDTVTNKRLFGPQFAAIIKRFTTGFIANSAQMLVDVERHGMDGNRVHRIPNGVPIPEASTAANRSVETRFIFMGRFDKEKALDVMIRGFATLPAGTPTRLVLLGDGPRTAELRKLAEELGVASRIEFAGRVEDVAPALRTAHFYLSTSLSEGMSNSLLEAMSFGVVPIVSRVSGVDDMVFPNENGLLFEAGDAAGFAAALAGALAMDDGTYEKMRHSARETLMARFSMESVAAQHLVLYEDLLSRLSSKC